MSPAKCRLFEETPLHCTVDWVDNWTSIMLQVLKNESQADFTVATLEETVIPSSLLADLVRLQSLDLNVVFVTQKRLITKNFKCEVTSEPVGPTGTGGSVTHVIT